MWVLLVGMILAIGVMIWADDPRIEDENRKFYNKYY